MDMLMAWRNIWRNPRRSILTVAAICFACVLLVFMLSWQFGSYHSMIEASVRVYTGHVQVQAKGYKEKHDMRKVVPDPEAVAGLLQAIPQVEDYAFRASGFGLLSSDTRSLGGMIVGIQPERQARVSTLESLIRKGDYLEPGDAEGVLVGEIMARNLDIGPGDELVMLGQGKDGSIAAMVYIVRGVFGSGMEELDRSTAYVDLAGFQDIFAMGPAVHEIVVTAKDLDLVAPLKAELARRLPSLPKKSGELVALDWKELQPGLLQTIQMDLFGGLIMYFILIIVVAFSILNTFLMAVFERTREFGIMLAIGVTPGRLSRILLLESGLITLLGLALGVALGCGLTLWLQRVGIEFSGAEEIMTQYGISGRMYPKLTWISALAGPVLVLAITMLSALYPALKARRLKAVEAMNTM